MEYIKTDLKIKMLITGGFNDLWEPYRPGSNVELFMRRDLLLFGT